MDDDLFVQEVLAAFYKHLEWCKHNRKAGYPRIDMDLWSLDYEEAINFRGLIMYGPITKDARERLLARLLTRYPHLA